MNVWVGGGGDTKGTRVVIRSRGQSGSVALLALLATSLSGVAQTQSTPGLLAGGTVAGLVRDASGMPQMGALIQVLLPDATLAASAISDPHGRFKLKDLPPGVYEVRATAALFLPAVRSHLRIESGSRSVVNLTLSTLLEPAAWLPAARRTSGDAGDDWTWTLRSSANRPILRAAGSAATAPIVFSSSAAERRPAPSQGRVTFIDGDGGFARGGAHDVFLLSEAGTDGGAIVLRADFSGPRTPYPVNPSADVSVGLQRSVGLGGVSRTVLSYTSHPELTGSESSLGLQGAVLRNAQRFELGDSLQVDAGSVITDANMAGNVLSLEPFLRVAVRPVPDLQFAYSYTAARGTERLEDLDRIQSAPLAAFNVDGRLRLAAGQHQAVAASTRLKRNGTLEVAAYRDVIQRATVNGSGALTAAEANGSGLLSDPTTQSFEAAVRGYNSAGLRVFVSEPLTPALSVSGEVVLGEALVASGAHVRSLEGTLASLRPQHEYATVVALDGKILASGTTLHSSYRWQPEETLTAVDSFHTGAEQAYLSCILRQPLRLAHIFPAGVDAVVNVSNLLAQGYQPFVSKDGRTLFLAESPRVLQAGVSFSF